VARPFSVDLGDGQGPTVGKFQRGDLGKPWKTNGRVRLPMDFADNRHLLLLGATGLGKTETALTIAEWAARSGRQIST
jgi:ATP-dependent Clp protease ATP-binding subunit ClpA